MWFDPRAALAELEAAPAAIPAPAPAEQFAGFAEFATPPGADAETPLDPEGLPFAACPACGGGAWWKPAAMPPEGPGWTCAGCIPSPAEMWRHACALPCGPGRPAGGRR